MEKEVFKEILISEGINEHTVESYIKGIRKPKYEVMYELCLKHGVSFLIWKDIKNKLK